MFPNTQVNRKHGVRRTLHGVPALAAAREESQALEPSKSRDLRGSRIRCDPTTGGGRSCSRRVARRSRGDHELVTDRRHLGTSVEFDAPHASPAIDRADMDLALDEHDDELETLALS